MSFIRKILLIGVLNMFGFIQLFLHLLVIFLYKIISPYTTFLTSALCTMGYHLLFFLIVGDNPFLISFQLFSSFTPFFLFFWLFLFSLVRSLCQGRPRCCLRCLAGSRVLRTLDAADAARLLVTSLLVFRVAIHFLLGLIVNNVISNLYQ